MPQQIVDRRQIGVHLPYEPCVEGHRLQLYDNEAAQPEMVEEQVEIEVTVGELETDLTSDEGEPATQLEQEALDVVDERLFDLALASRIAVPRKSNRYGSLKT